MKMWVLKYSLVFLISVFVNPVGGAVSFFYYGIENGLPETKVISITQDATGFIWLAGENSLFRFDGNQFRNYYYTENKDIELFQGKITGLFTDSKGILWVGSQYGILQYNLMLDRFMPVPGWERVHVSDISEDASGNLWIGSDEGLACLNTKNLQTTWFTSKDTLKTAGNQILPVTSIKHVACQPDGKVWFSSEVSELFLFDPEKRITRIFSEVGNTRFDLMNISHLKFYDNTIFISTINDGLLWFKPNEKEVKSNNFEGFGYTIHQFQKGPDSFLWLASNNGLIRYNLKTGEQNILTNELNNPHTLTRTANVFVFVDKDNNLWVSNGLKGINYGLNNVPFNHFTITEGSYMQLSFKEVTSMCFQNDNILWLGYEGGLIEKRFMVNGARKSFESASVKAGRPNGSVMSIYNDSRNQIWAGGWRTGLQKLNETGNYFEYPLVRPQNMKEILHNADVRGITEDAAGNIWFTMHGKGIGCYNPVTNEMKMYSFNQNDPPSGLSNDFTYDICIGNDNNIWISSAYGLSLLDPRTEKFTTFLHDDTIPNSLSSNEIITVICDKSGTIWVGTSNGLNVYNPEIKAFQPVLTDKEIPFLSVKSILSSKPGEIWVSTQSGLICLNYSWDTESARIRFSSNYFDRSDGLISSSFFYRSVAMNNSGQIYFSGNEGIDYFHPENALARDSDEQGPMITDLSINGVHLTENNLKHDGKESVVVLRYSDKMFSIGFTSLRFNNWKLKKFRYMVEGFNDKWIYTQNEQVATFASLPSGKYKFLLEVQGNNSGWIAMDKPLNIIVKPPFWMTWQFILFALLVGSLSVFLYQRGRSRVMLARQRELEQIIEKRTAELVKKNEELEMANQTKSKFFSIVSHDLRSPFSALISIIELINEPDNELDEDKKRELLKSTEISAKNTFDFLETLLTWARSQMNQTACNPELSNLSLLLAQNVELKNPAAVNKGITLRKHLPEKLEAYFDIEMVNTVVRNLLSNAIKFTKPGGTVDVSLIIRTDEAEVIIADSGIGMTDDDLLHMFDLGKSSRKGTMGERGTGLGLIICKEFIEKSNGRIWANANEPRGTVLHFTLPVSKF